MARVASPGEPNVSALFEMRLEPSRTSWVPGLAGSTEGQDRSPVPVMFKISPNIWKDGLRTAVAAGVALFVAQVFNLQHGYWAVITAVVIMQGNIGASVKAATDRLIGTLAGAALGFAVAALTPATSPAEIPELMIATGLLAMVASRYPSFRVAPVTAAIILITDPGHVEPWIAALYRVAEISLGCFIGIAVALLIAPSRAEARLESEVSAILDRLADLLEDDMQAGDGARRVAVAEEDIYAAYERIEKLAKEAEAEHATRLARSNLDINELRRHLINLRGVVFLLRRASTQFLAKPLTPDLAASAAEALESVRATLRALGKSIADGDPVPADSDLDDALARFTETASSSARQQIVAATPAAGDTQSPPIDHEALTFLANFSFALEEVRHSITQLAECVRGMAPQ